MASIRVRHDTGLLFFDFRYMGIRFREQSLLKDSKTNRAKMQSILKRIEKDIANACFDYAQYFPGSKNLKKLKQMDKEGVSGLVESVAQNENPNPNGHPTFKEFADIWVNENEIHWRRSHKRTQLNIIESHLEPVFGDKVVSQIKKAEILAFRSTLAKVPGRKAATLSPKRINAIMTPVRQILNEAADRYEFNTPYRNIKPLKVPKSDVEPFTLTEVQSILKTVRSDYKNYYTIRFFTGMRTGEIDGLKWQYVDFEKRMILIRETIVAGQEDYTKTDSSQREIKMSQLVYDALKLQFEATGRLSRFVFSTKEGKPIDHNNITKRVWYPLLRHLALRKRRPYQTRHTAATLWLAAGENPEWIARQIGHSTTEMLFRVYSRYVPNLTRQDGSAFERLLTANLTLGGTQDEI
ncbi:MAG: site-specific integrase [gamma proteobacterium symbiont of Bathyaustriella thionipta]|nr:site-specific integrase [gamma proteobacterium symbiont of Bathyaustriella thionipta]MCU7950669.1 site-specific integrase [gamma proteobacterium symbiont of Bathyaustriella thionipta]MCU7954015.1 site-specific integrase [gamma proteobacterium symbiont of Bathyaustriella thionipta]MCU7958030.1 site-specific integrase [gamma proteobacterium symbiont of Bathyaustriella thionipta]MCU7967527.1 site-specific integrase [gamma proteobacterium symbiont of Bathyaustriella thionipta]